MPIISDVFYLQNACVWMEERALPITSLVELVVAYARMDTLGFTVNLVEFLSSLMLTELIEKVEKIVKELIGNAK